MKEGDLVTMPNMPMRTKECPDNLGLVIGWNKSGDPWVEWIYPTKFWMNPSCEYKEDLIVVSKA
jgi:hypothetical protein